jgi:hypothetical protein
MVHAMQNSVAARREKARALGDVRANVEKALPVLVHCEHAVRPVTMQEKRLEKDRELPVQNEKNGDGDQASSLDTANLPWAGAMKSRRQAAFAAW